MALFPTSPSDGQTTTVNGITYTYSQSQTAWVRTGSAAGGGGGGGGAAGQPTQVQFNLAGSFAASPNLTFNTTTTTLAVSGNITATNLAGNGAGLTDINASNITSGNISPLHLSGNYNINVSGSAGTVVSSAQPNITSVGTLTSLSVNGEITGNGSGLMALNASNLSTGIVPTARLATGTPNNQTFLRGDGTWQIATVPVLIEDIQIAQGGTIGADTLGFRGLPQNSQSSNYTLQLSDQGRHISITSGSIIIPSNSTTPFPIGAAIVIYNNSADNRNVNILDDILRKAGTEEIGNQQISSFGLATLVKVAPTIWVITGNVI